MVSILLFAKVTITGLIHLNYRSKLILWKPILIMGYAIRILICQMGVEGLIIRSYIRMETIILGA